MTKVKAHSVIRNMGTAARINRLKAAKWFLENPLAFNDLVYLTFDTKNQYHHKGAWVMEYVLEKELTKILPLIDFFSNSLQKLTNDSAIRPIAKICQWLAREYIEKQNPVFIQAISKNNIKNIVATGFDWMIGDIRVAGKVYTMDTLYYFGKLSDNDFNWIHTELKEIILHNINSGSFGYQSHGKKILQLLTGS